MQHENKFDSLLLLNTDSEIATAEGWLYLATVQDLFSRRIVGWSWGESLEAELVCDAFERAAKTRGFAWQGELANCFIEIVGANTPASHLARC